MIAERKSPQSTLSLIRKCFACSKKEITPLLLPLLDTLLRIKDYHRYLVVFQQKYSSSYSILSHLRIRHQFSTQLLFSECLYKSYATLRGTFMSFISVIRAIPKNVTRKHDGVSIIIISVQNAAHSLH